MSKQKKVKLFFNKRPPETGYRPGMVHEVPAEVERDYIDGGYAVPTKETLPTDFPFRKQLIAAGIETVADVENAKDLTKVSGIGDKAEESIAKYLSGDDEVDDSGDEDNESSDDEKKESEKKDGGDSEKDDKDSKSDNKSSKKK